MSRHLLLFCSVLFLGSAFLCGGGDTECGPGTIEVDGECVPEESDTDTDADADTDSDGDADADTDTDTDTDPGEPSILSFATNVTNLTEGESVTFTAMVTHPDGIDQVIGGTLMSDGGATYGAFATAADEGSYTISLSWTEIDQVEVIEFDQGADESRGFEAQFYDVSGNIAERSLSLTLTCEGDAACDGACTDWEEDMENCGLCGRSCLDENPDSIACQDGGCAVKSDCAGAGPVVCDDVCADQGFDGCYDRRLYYEDTLCRDLRDPYDYPCGDPYGGTASGHGCYCLVAP